MSISKTQRHLESAFRAVTVAIVGAFLRHEIDPELIEDLGDVLEGVFRTHFERAARSRESQ